MGRSSEYVFAGLGCILGLLVTESTSSRGLRHLGFIRWPWTALARNKAVVAAALASVVLVGDVTIGTAFYQRLPEATHPQGYPWSVQPDVLAASRWARAHLGINQRFGAGAIDSRALATYGGQDTLDENLIWPIFFAGTMSSAAVQTIKNADVRYLLIDWRMTHGVPPTPGYYFSPQEPGAGQYRRPFSTAGLQKFSSSACSRLIYRSGTVQIFDVSQIERGYCTSPPADPGPTRHHEIPPYRPPSRCVPPRLRHCGDGNDNGPSGGFTRARAPDGVRAPGFSPSVRCSSRPSIVGRTLPCQRRAQPGGNDMYGGASRRHTPRAFPRVSRGGVGRFHHPAVHLGHVPLPIDGDAHSTGWATHSAASGRGPATRRWPPTCREALTAGDAAFAHDGSFKGRLGGAWS